MKKLINLSLVIASLAIVAPAFASPIPPSNCKLEDFSNHRDYVNCLLQESHDRRLDADKKRADDDRFRHYPSPMPSVTPTPKPSMSPSPTPPVTSPETSPVTGPGNGGFDFGKECDRFVSACSQLLNLFHH